MYPVQCLAAPCLNQGPNLPFHWFSLYFVKGCSSHAELLNGSSDKPGMADSVASSAFTSLKIDLHLHSPHHPHLSQISYHQSHFFQGLVWAFFFSSPKRKDVLREGNPLLGVDLCRIWSEEQIYSHLLSLHIVPPVWNSVPTFTLKCAPRILYTFLLANNLPLQPRIRTDLPYETIISWRTRTWGLISLFLLPPGGTWKHP